MYSSCNLGFAGSNCSQYDCLEVNDCSGNGTCVEPNLCSCNLGFEGGMCLNFSCETRSRCSGQCENFCKVNVLKHVNLCVLFIVSNEFTKGAGIFVHLLHVSNISFIISADKNHPLARVEWNV